MKEIIIRFFESDKWPDVEGSSGGLIVDMIGCGLIGAVFAYLLWFTG